MLELELLSYEQVVSEYNEKFGAVPETYCDTTYDVVWATAESIEILARSM